MPVAPQSRNVPPKHGGPRGGPESRLEVVVRIHGGEDRHPSPAEPAQYEGQHLQG